MSGAVIVGGAAMGWATAYHLRSLDRAVEATVIERDPTLRHSSTMRSDGNVRIQFNLEENIAISMYAIERLEAFPQYMAVGDDAGPKSGPNRNPTSLNSTRKRPKPLSV